MHRTTTTRTRRLRALRHQIADRYTRLVIRLEQRFAGLAVRTALKTGEAWPCRVCHVALYAHVEACPTCHTPRPDGSTA
jgi:rubrerythrin